MAISPKGAQEALVEAITEAKQRGWMIVPNLWIDPVPKYCCPLGAMAMKVTGCWDFTDAFNAQTVSCWVIEAVADTWELDDHAALRQITKGCDPPPMTSLPFDKTVWYDLGNHLRRRYMSI